MLKIIFALILFAIPAFASDTIWVEMSFQKKARQHYEQLQREYEEEAESLRNARAIINSASPKQFHETNLPEILDGKRTGIAITASDKKRYALLIKSRLDTLKSQYEENEKVLRILQSNLRSGPYVPKGNISAIYEKIGVSGIDSLAAIKESSADGDYYDWQDWLRLRLASNIPFRKSE